MDRVFALALSLVASPFNNWLSRHII